MKSILKPKIRNVVCTAKLKQTVNIVQLSDLKNGIYDQKIYGGRCGYVKTPEMDGRVTIFRSGKMISIGGKSVKKSIDQLNHAKNYLVHENLIDEIKLVPIIQNIVATLDVQQSIPIDILSSKIPGAVYDPETFAGLILKGTGSCNFLIFSSGKIVVTGTKSASELTSSSFELLQRLNQFFDEKISV